jgi:hypothetical protein
MPETLGGKGSGLYIAQTKEKYGIIERENDNKSPIGKCRRALAFQEK